MNSLGTLSVIGLYCCSSTSCKLPRHHFECSCSIETLHIQTFKPLNHISRLCSYRISSPSNFAAFRILPVLKKIFCLPPAQPLNSRTDRLRLPAYNAVLILANCLKICWPSCPSATWELPCAFDERRMNWTWRFLSNLM